MKLSGPRAFRPVVMLVAVVIAPFFMAIIIATWFGGRGGRSSAEPLGTWSTWSGGRDGRSSAEPLGTWSGGRGGRSSVQPLGTWYGGRGGERSLCGFGN